MTIDLMSKLHQVRRENGDWLLTLLGRPPKGDPV